MAKNIFAVANYNLTALADTVAGANATYLALKGNSTTVRNLVSEINIGGLATVSSPCIGLFAYSSTLGITPTGLAGGATNGPMDPNTAALSVANVAYTAAATGPARAVTATFGRLTLGLNLFGGIFKWNSGQREEFIVYGNAVNTGEAFLSAFTGTTTGAASSHILYETI